MQPIAIPRELRELIAQAEPELLQRIEQFLASAPRACTYVSSERVAKRPLWWSALMRLFGGETAPPVLGPLESKFGGTPYCDDPHVSWQGNRFLGQVNFAQIPEPPPGAPRTGILAVDVCPSAPRGFRTRWYPDPNPASALDCRLVESVGKWEARMRFKPGWSLPDGDAWNQMVPEGDGELATEWSE